MATFSKHDLHNAFSKEEVVPYFQPIVELRTGLLSGFEILARWKHPAQGVIPPDAFIPIAEAYGLIGELTNTILTQAFVAARSLPQHLRLSINVSPYQLYNESLAHQVVRTAEEVGFSLTRLTIEITESALIGNLELARSMAEQLKSLGVRLALDDFGTGYSSLRHLQALPFDEIKVDHSFVQSMLESRESRKIIAAVLGLGQSLGLCTVSEGIETKAQADMLLRMGCDCGQGWFFGKPVCAEHLPLVLSYRNSRPPSSEKRPVMDAKDHWEMLPPQRLAQLQAIYDGAPVGLCFLDRDLRYISINRRLAEINNLPIGAHLGRVVQEIRPDILVRLEKHLLNALAGKSTRDLELEIPHPDDPHRTRSFLATHNPVRDEAGEVVGVSVAVSDITDFKNTQKALRESEDNLRQTIDLNPQIPWSAAPDGTIIDFSPRWTVLTGLSREDTLGEGWTQAVHPNDLPATLDRWSRSLLSGDPVDVQFRIRMVDGRWVWMRSRAKPYRNDEGNIVRWYGLVEDIDDYIRALEALRNCEGRL
jgi:PAS domain S-box-containing protein